MDSYDEKHNLHQNEVVGFVHEKVTDFPADSRAGRVVEHITLGGLYRCIDGTGDTTQPEKWRPISFSAGSRFNFGMQGPNLKSQWLRLNGGEIVSKITGHRLWFDGVLICLAVQAANDCQAIFRIYKRSGTGSRTEIASITLAGENGKHSFFYIPVDAGQAVSCKMEVSSGVVSNPNIDAIIIPK